MKAIEGKRVIFYIPTNDNEGNDLNEEMVEFKNQALIVFGGFTEHQKIWGNWIRGWNIPKEIWDNWMDNDKYYQDTIIPIEIAGFDDDDSIELYANKIKRNFKQEAIYLIIDGKAYIH